MYAVFFALKRYDAKAPTAFLGNRHIETLVIDPGHGGYDCGALGVDGTEEKALNLSISEKIRDICTFCGIRTVMTREDDTPRTTKEAYSEREDLEHRVKISDAIPDAAMMSIHQNTYPSEIVSGVQVLYAENDSSERWGTITQNNIVSLLDTGNRRVAQPAQRKLYITANTRCPTLLIECGFISNASDLSKLKDNDYQTCFALLASASFMQFRSGINI